MTAFHLRFITFSVVDVALLYTSCWLIKKYIKIFPEQLIPVLSVAMSVLTAMIWIHAENISPGIYYMFEIGIMHGFGVVGIHQFWKQIKKYVLYRRGLKNLKEIRKSKKIS